MCWPTEWADEAVAGAGEVLIGANVRVQGGTHAQGGSEAVSSACGGSAEHGHRDEDTVQSAGLGRMHGSPVATASFTNRLDTMASLDANKPDIALIMADDVMSISLWARMPTTAS